MHSAEHNEHDFNADDDIPGPTLPHNAFPLPSGPSAPVSPFGLQCPRCHSHRIVQRHRARRIGAALGTLAGAIGGACRTAAASEMGYAIGALTLGLPGAALGAVSGAVVSALLGGTTGWTIGAKLGAALDASLLDDYRCLACQHTFSQPTR